MTIYVKINVMVLGQRDASVLRRFEEFCALEGLRPEVALRDADAIEAFLRIGCRALAPHSLGTYRSTLRRLGGAPRSTSAFCASPAPPPYDRAEAAALWSMAAHQSSALRVANATVLVATTLGAGLRAGELAHLRALDVVRSSRQVSVLVSGHHPRIVPVLAPYAEQLAALARDPGGYVFRPGAVMRDTKNLVGEIAAKLTRDPDEVAFSSARARATFICRHLESRTALGELCTLAGLADVESLARYARHVEGTPTSKAALRAQATNETRQR
jgi:integrase